MIFYKILKINITKILMKIIKPSKKQKDLIIKFICSFLVSKLYSKLTNIFEDDFRPISLV